MTLIHAGTQRSWNAQRPVGRLADRPVSRPVNRPVSEPLSYRTGRNRPTRPGPTRPAGSPLRYHGSGVAVSTARHGRRPVTLATAVGLALVAGVITLWLGLMANFGSMLNGDTTESSASVPGTLAVVRVEPGESLQQLAARVAPGSSVRDVVDRIRDLNALNSNAVAAGQTLIAPVG